MAVFWDVAPCILVEIDGSFGDAYYLHYQGDCYGPDEGSQNLLRQTTVRYQKTAIFILVTFRTWNITMQY
jgi:hypothetical protein